VILINDPIALEGLINAKKAQNLSIGFVPTMGALHLGHISLIEEAKANTDFVVCSIFVNPTQFNNPDDLANYPRTLEADLLLLTAVGCDVLFHPEVSKIYQSQELKLSAADYGNFIHVLEGAKRPGHFDGVITILTKLFKMVHPNQVYFGQKDYQQCMVVETLIARDFPNIKFNRCAIVREADGLAMSSRNARLTKEERAIAPQIFKTLQSLSQQWQALTWEAALNEARNSLSNLPFELEYLEVCDPNTLDTLQDYSAYAVVLVAVNLGSTRLIDNHIL
jgi:pantoate--beta-alanine ligase